MSWEVKVELTEAAARGFMSPFQPRGLYQVRSMTKKGETAEKKKPAILFEHKIVTGYLYAEDGSFKSTQDYNGQNILSQILLDAPESDGGRDARTADIKSMVLSHGAMTREQIKNVKGEQPLNSGLFDDKEAWILFDPPQDQDSYSEKRYISREEAQELISGKRKLTVTDWPQTKNIAKSQQRAAQGEAKNKAASMLGGATVAGGALPAFGGGGVQMQEPSAPVQNGFGISTPATTGGGFGGFGGTARG